MLRLVGPVTLRYPASDPEAARICRELQEAYPAEIEAEPCDGTDLELLDSYGRPTGVRFRGAPVGQEYTAFLEGVGMLSRGDAPLSPLGRAQARDLAGELHIYTTPA